MVWTHLLSIKLPINPIFVDTIFERNPDLPRASPEAVEKLRRALRKVDLKMLDEDKLTNRACVEAIGDICEDSIKKFTCEYDILYFYIESTVCPVGQSVSILESTSFESRSLSILLFVNNLIYET